MLQYFWLAFNISKVRHWSPVLNWNMFLTPNSSPCLALSPAIPLKYLLAFWFCIATLSNCLKYIMNWRFTFNVTNWWLISNSYCHIKVVSSNPTHGEVYLIQHYVIKFVSDLWHVNGFLMVLRFPPPIKQTSTI